MKISKIQINNYRLLKKFSMDLEEELSLILGKNNCGKTSLLTILEKFLNGNSNSFSYEDFNLDFKHELIKILDEDIPGDYKSMGISMKLFIDYSEKDNLSNISTLMMDLNPANNKIVLLFEYVLLLDELVKLKQDLASFKAIESGKGKPKTTDYYLKENYTKYFSLYKKSIDADDSLKFIDLEKEKTSLANVINYKYIKANRDVSNKEPSKSLSMLSSRIYDKFDTDEHHQIQINDFKNTLRDTDESLGLIYEKIFEDTINKVKKFGGIKLDETQIKITSTLQHKELLKGNTTVIYNHNGNELPEHYNGLGYMNLISMIFEIEILINEFKRKQSEAPADINLLFIEEPEAHTHPQMQYVFIKNIKNLLKDGIVRSDGQSRKIQYFISTHSSHIVSESNFDDIKYFKKEENGIIAKNLKNLEDEYKKEGKEENYKFLKQYLTLTRAELFFADKAIFIEGDTERILLPAMMKKIDLEMPSNPLLSQNISIVEVGNYSHIFEKFIDFVGVKSLIITDIDSAKANSEKCRVTDLDASTTTNYSLKFFYSHMATLNDFVGKQIRDLIIQKKQFENPSDQTVLKKWTIDNQGHVVCTYQTNETNKAGIGYHARSFEDAFFHLNRQFIIDNKAKFKSLKNIAFFDDTNKDSYELADCCIGKKPAFAIEILLNSKPNPTNGHDFNNWEIPDYIKQGLLWLKD